MIEYRQFKREQHIENRTGQAKVEVVNVERLRSGSTTEQSDRTERKQSSTKPPAACQKGQGYNEIRFITDYEKGLVNLPEICGQLW